MHCLLIETDRGLVLVDAGIGLRDYASPTGLVRLFLSAIGIPRDPEQTAAQRTIRLGYEPEDVQHIVLTHLHVDHAGGLPDCPLAKIHVFGPEYESAINPRRFSLLGRFYIAAHWSHGPDRVVHTLEGEQWFGLDCIRAIEGESFAVLLVPLVGHTRGHCGVAVRTPEGWLLHSGDAYVRQMQPDLHHPHSPFPGWIQPLARRLLPPKPPSLLQTLARDHSDEVQLFCTHDRQTLSKFQGLAPKTFRPRDQARTVGLLGRV